MKGLLNNFLEIDTILNDNSITNFINNYINKGLNNSIPLIKIYEEKILNKKNLIQTYYREKYEHYTFQFERTKLKYERLQRIHDICFRNLTLDIEKNDNQSIEDFEQDLKNHKHSFEAEIKDIEYTINPQITNLQNVSHIIEQIETKPKRELEELKEIENEYINMFTKEAKELEVETINKKYNSSRELYLKHKLEVEKYFELILKKLEEEKSKRELAKDLIQKQLLLIVQDLKQQNQIRTIFGKAYISKIRTEYLITGELLYNELYS